MTSDDEFTTNMEWGTATMNLRDAVLTVELVPGVGYLADDLVMFIDQLSDPECRWALMQAATLLAAHRIVPGMGPVWPEP